jgi:hypothetical protein
MRTRHIRPAVYAVFVETHTLIHEYTNITMPINVCICVVLLSDNCLEMYAARIWGWSLVTYYYYLKVPVSLGSRWQISCIDLLTAALLQQRLKSIVNHLHCRS